MKTQFTLKYMKIGLINQSRPAFLTTRNYFLLFILKMKSYSNFARGKNSSNIALKYTSIIIEISMNRMAEMLREMGENHDF